MDDIKISNLRKNKIDKLIEISLTDALTNYQLISKDHALIRNLKLV